MDLRTVKHMIWKQAGDLMIVFLAADKKHSKESKYVQLFLDGSRNITYIWGLTDATNEDQSKVSKNE